jgi:hypothetical protein
MTKIGKPEYHDFVDDNNFARGYRLPSPFPGKRSVRLVLGKGDGIPFAMLRRSRCQGFIARCDGREFTVTVGEYLWDLLGDTDVKCLQRARELGSAAKILVIDGRLLIMHMGDSRSGVACRLRACADTVRECFVKGRPIADIIVGFFRDSGKCFNPDGMYLSEDSKVIASILKEADDVESGIVPLSPMPDDKALARGLARRQSKSESKSESESKSKSRSESKIGSKPRPSRPTR